jgi:hypothetical protein
MQTTSLGMLVFEVAPIVIPLGLVLWTWRRYLALDPASAEDLFQMRLGVGLVSISISMWLAVWLLMALGDISEAAKSIRENLSPGMLGLINLLLAMTGFACSRLGRKSTQETVPLRRAIAVSSGCVGLLWLLLASNPH